MKLSYPFILERREDGSFHAAVPDLALCEAQGSSVVEVLDRIYEAAKEWLEVELLEFEGDLPPVSDPADLREHLLPGQEVRDMSITLRLTDGYDE